MRIIFMGTPGYSVPTLAALIEAGHEIVAVYTQPPRPSGRRGLETRPSPVHEFADGMGLPVHTPVSLKSPEEQARFAAMEADIAVVVAYGLLLPEPVLAAPRLGAWNGHASLLPRWRGAAPIQRAIMAGDGITGVMIMKMDRGLDTGPVALAGETAIPRDMSAGRLHDVLAGMTARLMVEAIERLSAGTLETTDQPEAGVTYAAKIAKEEARIDFARPAHDVHNHIRGLSPFPGAWCEISFKGRLERVKILASEEIEEGEGQTGQAGTVLDDRLLIACAKGAVRFLRLQRAGGKPLDAEEFLRGTPMLPGTVLS